jgi:prepilin-type N-terminal cleavage/methylation domain-containing protein
MKRGFPHSLRRQAPYREGHRGFTLLEVLLGLSILAAGVLAVLALFPWTLRANERAELRTLGAALGAMKVDEIRRDEFTSPTIATLVGEIEALTEPTDPITFPLEPRLAYRFSGETILYAGVNDERSSSGVARVIIQESPGFRANPVILEEFRFQ